MSFQLRMVALALGLCAGLALVGCGPAKDAKEGKPNAAESEHPSVGPHKGHLIELGNEEYHAEIVHDDATHTVTIYLLDSAAKKAVTTAATSIAVNLVVDGKPAQFTVAAKPIEGEPAEQSSRFESSDEKLSVALDAEGASGRMNVSIAGKEYSGTIGAHKHD
jgi:hypothetical protein